MHRIRLKENKAKKLRNHYLWVFRDDVATQWKDRRDIEDGSIVEVVDDGDAFVGVGMYNSKSHILIRMLARQNVAIHKEFLFHRLKRAVDYRAGLRLSSNGYRLVHAEADGLPGLIVDRFGKTLVVQIRTLGMEKMKNAIVENLVELVQPDAVYERSDMDSRAEEGLEKTQGLLYGRLPSDLVITENDLTFRIQPATGHKTGFYLDQRDNRHLVRSLVRPGYRCLDLFCYSGGFSVAMAASGGIVTGVDQDSEALAWASDNAALNRVTCEFKTADAFAFLKEHAPGHLARYDVVVIDPPAFAKKKEGADRLKWTYWELMVPALQLLRHGGHLILSSCAYHMSVDMMVEAARYASADLGMRLRAVTITYQPDDHPWILQIPETLYLKTIYFQVV